MRLPLFPLALGVLAAATAAPLALSALEGDRATAVAFGYSGLFVALAAAGLALTMSTWRRQTSARTELRDLMLCWFLVPLFAAVPVWLSTPVIGFGGAWFEMLSAFTTTGGTLYEELAEVPRAVHLWRGMVAWLGGLLTLSAAYAILAPRSLGGFEVIRGVPSPDAGSRGAQRVRGLLIGAGPLAPMDERLTRAVSGVLPVYAGLSALLAVLFSAAGEEGLAATVHALAILSTSGISPREGGLAAGGLITVELIAVLFLVLAATRLTYVGRRRFGHGQWRRDPELAIMAAIVLVASLALFLRHWIAAITVADGGAAAEALPALWGAFFTTLSFLTTTGFESSQWAAARSWSGLDSPGLILVVLCAIGGGAATTAGGAKLIRAYALLRHGYRELERLAIPRSAVATGVRLRRIAREGEFLAWAFVMLYISVIFAVTLALTLAGLDFEPALVASVAAISNTGPVVTAAAPESGGFARLDDLQRAIVGIAMVLGRIETLALVSLFAPDPWHRLGKRPKMVEKEEPGSHMLGRGGSASGGARGHRKKIRQ